MNRPMLRSTLLVLAIAPGLQGCAAEEEPDVEDSEAAVGSALPITGVWGLARWQGHYGMTQGSTVDRRRVDTSFDVRAEQGAAMIDLDPTGEGTITAHAHCRPDLSPGTSVRGGPAPVLGDPVQLVSSVIGIIRQIRQIMDSPKCDTTRSSLKTVAAHRKYRVFGQPSEELWANLGVYGENAGARAAEKECRTLRGVRWMLFDDGTAACAGYADGAARTVKMLVQAPGEIYVQRLVLRRPSDP